MNIPHIMTYLINALEKAMEVTPRDSGWAKEMNIETRRLNIDVWTAKPDPKDVAETVIPILERAHRLVMAVPHEGEFGNQVEHYAHCIAIRMINMYRYIIREKPYTLNEAEAVSADSIEALVQLYAT